MNCQYFHNRNFRKRRKEIGRPLLNWYSFLRTRQLLDKNLLLSSSPRAVSLRLFCRKRKKKLLKFHKFITNEVQSTNGKDGGFSGLSTGTGRPGVVYFQARSSINTEKNSSTLARGSRPRVLYTGAAPRRDRSETRNGYGMIIAPGFEGGEEAEFRETYRFCLH